MFDWIILGNLIISAAVGAVFGILGAMVQYRFDRKRDDIAWERKKEELLLQWEHEQRENRNREMRADMDVIFEQARQSFDGTPSSLSEK